MGEVLLRLREWVIRHLMVPHTIYVGPGHYELEHTFFLPRGVRLVGGPRTSWRFVRSGRYGIKRARSLADLVRRGDGPPS